MAAKRRESRGNQALGARMRTIRKSAHLPIASLAKKMHIRPDILSKIEKGKVLPDVRDIEAFLNANESAQKYRAELVELYLTSIRHNLAGSDVEHGNLTPLSPQTTDLGNKKPVTLDSMRLEQVYLMFGNYTSAIDVETEYIHSELVIPEDIQNAYSFLADQAKRKALATGNQYFIGPNARLIRFSETTYQDGSGYEKKRIKLHVGPVSWEEFTVLNTNLDHRLPSGQTIGQRYALAESVYEHDRDFTWCQLSNILPITMIPITTDGYGLVQARNPKGVSTEGNKYTGGIAENMSYCQELCMQGSRGVLSYLDAVLKGHAVHDLRQIMRST